jgi:hypothetical protein
MHAEQIFRTTLKELAADGNEKARLALTLCADVPPADPNVISDAKGMLQNAIIELQGALKANGLEWTSTTDKYIATATRMIVATIAKL